MQNLEISLKSNCEFGKLDAGGDAISGYGTAFTIVSKLNFFDQIPLENINTTIKNDFSANKQQIKHCVKFPYYYAKSVNFALVCSLEKTAIGNVLDFPLSFPNFSVPMYLGGDMNSNF